MQGHSSWTSQGVFPILSLSHIILMLPLPTIWGGSVAVAQYLTWFALLTETLPDISTHRNSEHVDLVCLPHQAYHCNRGDHGTNLKDCEGWAAGFRMQDKGRALPSFSTSSTVPMGSVMRPETIVLSPVSSNTRA